MSEREHSVPEPYVIAKSRSQHKRVKLNVGGIRYTYLQHTLFLHKVCHFDARHEVMWKILHTLPDSKLGMLAKVGRDDQLQSLANV